MKVLTTDIDDLLILEPVVFTDERGFFMESYNTQMFNNHGIDISFVQDNQSFSRKGVVRGLHFQKNPSAQTKLVRVLSGAIVDVVVDLRADRKTFKKTYSIELSDKNFRQLLVPKGFAHGFVVLSDTANVLYKCDEYYNKDSELGIRFDDPDLNVDWHLPKDKLLVSSKDQQLPYLRDLNYQF
jgi:dTDP-4-dehydrorhamnose 3,5-epimerase